MERRPLRERARHLLVSAAIASLGLAIAEGGLRLAGFQRDASPVVLRFGYPNSREIVGLFRTDRRLFWRLRPGTAFDTDEGPVRINAAGYRGALPAGPAPPRLLRVAVMGDSVAFGGPTCWPDLLAARLEARLPGRPVEVLNFGVPGYSVVQGLRQFTAEVAPLRPTVVVIAYGWNDHWLARGDLVDSERRLPAPAVALLASWLSRLRLAQALHALVRPGTAVPTPRAQRRVPPAEFRERMAAFIREVRGAGGHPVLVALPSALAEGRVPAYLADGGFVDQAEDAIADHRLYASLVRDAATAGEAPFIDLQPLMVGAGGGPEASLFSRDGIHPNAEGQARIAAGLEATVLEASAAPVSRQDAG